MPENNIFSNIEEQSQEANITLDLDNTLHAKKMLWLNNFYEIVTHKSTLPYYSICNRCFDIDMQVSSRSIP